MARFESVEPSQAANVNGRCRRSPASGKYVAIVPARPTVPCAGCETMRSVSALPSGSRGRQRNRQRYCPTLRRRPSDWSPPAARFGFALSFVRPVVAGVAADLEAGPTPSSCRTRSCSVRAPAHARAPCRGSRRRGTPGTGAGSSPIRSWCAFTQACPTGCMPCGPPLMVDGERRRGRRRTRRACPRAPGARRSARCRSGAIDVYSACVEPWQASHLSPPWPVENRYSESPAAGASAVVANVGSTAARTWPGGVEYRRVADRAAVVRRGARVAALAGGSSSQPMRPGAPTALIDPWQSWHWIASEPSAATASPSRRAGSASPTRDGSGSTRSGWSIESSVSPFVGIGDGGVPAVDRRGQRQHAGHAAACRAPPTRGRPRTGSAGRR